MTTGSIGEGVLDILKQETRRREFESMGDGAWTVVYSNWNSPDSNGGYFATLTPKKLRPDVVAKDSWDASKGSGEPGFVEYYGRRPRRKYLRYGNDEGIEPIVLTQTHYGVKPRMLPQISEEFRMYHNLWSDAKGARLYKVTDDGNEYVAAEVDHDHVRIRTKLLRQFQAGKQMDLVLFVDSVQFASDPEGAADLGSIEDTIGTETMRVSLFASDRVDGKKRPFSRYLGKKVLVPPPLAKAGIWPFDDEIEDYPDFIIGEDADGDQRVFTCDPESLANYFGKNSDAPHYLTPVYFRRQVLQKYFEQPEKFDVADGYLRCGSLWGLQIDNDHPHHVMVFLGDLGRDLPSTERLYWKSFNVAPSGGISETVYKRAFLGQFADAEAPDLKFKSLYRRFNKAWREAKGWEFFKPMHEGDAHVLQQLRIPLSDSQSELEDQVRGLAKLLIDSLNEKEIQRLLKTKIDNEKGLGKLTRWLDDEKYVFAQRDGDYLHRLQRLRSKMAAHRKASDYDAMLRAEGVKDDKIEEAVHLLWNACLFLQGMAEYFDAPLT